MSAIMIVVIFLLEFFPVSNATSSYPIPDLTGLPYEDSADLWEMNPQSSYTYAGKEISRS